MADIITLSIEAGLFHYGLLNFQYRVFNPVNIYLKNCLSKKLKGNSITVGLP